MQSAAFLRAILLHVTLVALTVCSTASAKEAKRAEQSIGWRNQGFGHFVAEQPPTKWSTEDQVRWKTAMPGNSLSSPVVVGESVITTSEPTELICVNLSDGKVQWQRSHQYEDMFPAEKTKEINAQLEKASGVRQKIELLQKDLQELQQSDPKAAETPEGKEINEQVKLLEEQYEQLTAYPPPPQDGTGNATATPVTDGQNVWAVFATGIVSSHGLDGERNWMKFIERPQGRVTASPLLVDGLLIVHLKHLLALDPQTGEVVWKLETPLRTGSPIAVAVGKTNVIVTPAGAVVRANDGQLLAEGLFDLAYCSPIAHEDVVYAVQRGNTKAIRLTEKAEGVNAEVLWEKRSAEDDRCASPVYHDGLLYTVTTNGILDVLDAESGERVYRERLDLGEGRVDPSLAVAGNQLFVSSNNGTTLVAKPGREFAEVARNPLEGFSSSVFFHGNQLCIRTSGHLYCIGNSDSN